MGPGQTRQQPKLLKLYKNVAAKGGMSTVLAQDHYYSDGLGMLLTTFDSLRICHDVAWRMGMTSLATGGYFPVGSMIERPIARLSISHPQQIMEWQHSKSKRHHNTMRAKEAQGTGAGAPTSRRAGARKQKKAANATRFCPAPWSTTGCWEAFHNWGRNPPKGRGGPCDLCRKESLAGGGKGGGRAGMPPW